MKYLKWEKEKKKKPKTPVQNSMCSEIFIKNEGDNDFLEKKKKRGRTPTRAFIASRTIPQE